MSCGSDRTIRLWNPHREGTDGPTSALMIKTYKGLHGYEIRDVAMYVHVHMSSLHVVIPCVSTSENDNSKFVSCGRDKAVFQWDVASGKTIRKFEGHVSSVNAVTYNDDCSVLATASYDSTVRLWDVRFQGHVVGDYGLDCAFSHDDASVLSGSEDGRVMVWDMLTKDPRRSFQAHDRAVRTVATHPTDAMVLTGSVDSTVKVWVPAAP
ncbi:hypothetical protein DYB30_000165 [Aphanomyces astaci]|uniref:Uncharacterized protein n=1 Tax=Aphanomyces astaci TaxID=112090 RepID=A0A397E161_APHAT|nr:hypothetical protein DYB30_000165 [Aphanomyces astaci]